MILYTKTLSTQDPERGTSKSAGIDIFIPNTFRPTNLKHGDSIKINSGLKFKIPKDHVMILFNKSGVASKKGLQVGACVIDEDYQGEVHINLIKTTKEECVLYPGEKIVQALILPVKYPVPYQVTDQEELYKGEITERGEGGFGSTDKEKKSK